jgi:7-carboxy-7-deazaguanine synthase
MPYVVKEVFYTLQGEGLNAGRAAVFVRFSGCNLWNGRHADRHKGIGGCAHWCDTNFVGTDGEGGGRFASPSDLAYRVATTWPAGSSSEVEKLVVFTGGEPALQLDDQLLAAVHDQGFTVAIETNGSIPLPNGIDWVCVSPKAGAPLLVTRGDELKFVYPQDGLEPSAFEELSFSYLLIQPRDGLAREKHLRGAVQYCLSNPKWRLSLQTHKVVGLP